MNETSNVAKEQVDRSDGGDADLAAVSSRTVVQNLIKADCNRITPDMVTLIQLSEPDIEVVARTVPGGARNVQDIYPLSSLQEGMLFHHLLNEHSDGYLFSALFELQSRAHLEAFVDALQEVIDRHDVLRTAVIWENLPQAVQVVYRKALLPIEELPPDGERTPLEQLTKLMQPRNQKLDLTRAPLLRLLVGAGASNAPWHVLLQAHHLICDYETRKAIVAEIATCLRCRAHELQAPIPYRNYISELIESSKTKDAEAFFRVKLYGIEEPTAPFALLNAYGDGVQIKQDTDTIEPEFALRIRIQARRFRVNTAIMLHAAMALVVARTSGREDAVYGTVLSSRQKSLRGKYMLGMFVNTLPLCVRLQGITVKELVEQTFKELDELSKHASSSLTLAQRSSSVSSGTPLFTTILNYVRNAADPAMEKTSAPGVRMIAHHGVWTNYPISIQAVDSGAEIALKAETDSRVSPHRMLGYLRIAIERLVEALEHAPQTPVKELSILPDSERFRLTELSRGSIAHYPHDKVIHQLFEEQVERTPHALAVAYEAHSLSYYELNSRANQLAWHLRDKGVGPDQLVALHLGRGVEMLVAMLGILKAGGAYVPLDPTDPPERLAYLLNDIAPRVVLSRSRLAAGLLDPAAETVVLDEDWSEIARCRTDNPRGEDFNSQPHHLAYVIYTSGSTGQPKGVMIEHRGVVNVWRGLEQVYEKTAPCERIAWNSSPTFDASVQQWVQLISGRSLFIVPQDIRIDATRLLAFLDDHRIDAIDCTPSQIKSWISMGLLQNAGCRLRMVLVGGEAIDAELWNRLARSKDIAFFNVYGPTECTVEATVAPINGAITTPHIGRPMVNRTVHILGRDGKPAPVGVKGEIFIGGADIARGYLNLPELTAERFIVDPLSLDPQARLYKTGDVGRWREIDGAIEYLGRNDDQVKIRGYRIELGEIEARMQRYPAVKQAAVIVREDVPGEKKLVGYVIARETGSLNLEELRWHLKKGLPAHMVPGAIIVLESFPLTNSGKLNRRELPTPESESYIGDGSYSFPLGEVETELARIWQELLGVSRVGRHDNFFELGGHSLLAVRALVRVNSVFGCALTVTDVYRNATMSELAARIGGFMKEEELIDLSRESTLDDDIVALPGLPYAPARNVLLTGATGFVGRFLLVQLLQETDATVHCIVRAESRRHALSRVKGTLLNWDLWRDEFEDRIVAVPGDLGLPGFGVDAETLQTWAQDIDSIYHCAVSMNHLETYAMAKATNVDAARDLVKLATLHRPKLINHISSLSVFRSGQRGAPRVVDEQTPIEKEMHSTSRGYAASKWVAEKIFMNATLRGIPCNIFRVGLTWADTLLGRFDEFQQVYRVFKSCFISGCGIEGYRFGMAPTPVDYVARAIVFLANAHTAGNGIFHISSSGQLEEGVFERCNDVAGTSLKLVPYYDWIGKMKQLYQQGQPLPAVPLIEFAFSMDEEAFRRHQHMALENIHFDCGATYRELEAAGIVAPDLTGALLKLSVDAMFHRDAELRELVAPLDDPRLQRSDGDQASVA